MVCRRRWLGGSAAALLALPLLVVGGCRQSGPASEPTAGGEPAAPEPAAQSAPAAPVSDAPANELGRVPVLEYHKFAEKEGRWTRTPASFRKDLEWLYQNGFRAVSMRDYVTGNINLPKGASPVVFTFDDADPGQFRYLEKDGQPVVDPDCAVGMLEAFAKKHPDFGLKATFYVLPYGFGQGKYTHQKFKHIADQGMELGNHTVTHANLKRISNSEVQAELAGAQKEVQKAVPGYRFFSLALPLGIAPKEKSLGAKGASGGMTYEHGAVLLVGSTPASSPFDKDFKPLEIPRVQATDMVEAPYQLTAQLKNLLEKKDRRYVSDGDPSTITVPASLKDELGTARVGSKKVVVR